MPELTLDELRILTRVRFPAWIGIFWMCGAAFAAVVSTPKPEYGRWPYLAWVGLFLAGLLWFLWATRRELERQRVLKAQEARKFGREVTPSERAAIDAEARKEWAIGNPAAKGDAWAAPGASSVSLPVHPPEKKEKP
jgi:hypothetical protein